MDTLKAVGGFMLAMAIMAAVVVAAFTLIQGVAYVSVRALPILNVAYLLAFAACILLLPFSIFAATRGFAAVCYFISSYVFGLATWVLGFILLYALWGGFWVFVGIFIGGFGVVPLAMIATGWEGAWHMCGELAIGLVLAYGTRLFGLYLGAKVDTDLEKARALEY